VARSVGNIEITVDLDTGRLQAQAKRTGHIVGEEFADAIEEELDHLEVNLAEIDGRREAQVARKQIEGILRGMEGLVDIDLTEARAALAEFREQQEAIDLVLNTDIELSPDDLAEIRSDFRRTKEIIERNAIEVEMNIALDEAQIENERLRAQAQLEDMKIHAEMELALSEAILDAERFRLEQEHNDLEMQLALQMAVAEAEITRFRQAQEANDIEIGVDVKEGKGLSGRMALIAGAILALGESATVALSGATAAATSVLASGIQAVGASAGAAVPLVGAFGAALTATVVGTRGFTDAMEAVNEEFATAQTEGRAMNLALLESSDAMRNLSPAAADAALAFADIRDELQDLRVVVQDDLFAGMDDAISSMADTALPSIQEGLRVAAQSVNDFGRALADVAAETDFQGMIESLDPALDDALDSGLAFVRTIEPFLKAAAPAAERLAEMIERGAEAFESWVNQNPDTLAGFLDDGLTSLDRWVELLQSTGDLLGTIFDAGATSGDNFVVSLNNIIERWDAWLEGTEGQTALTDFFDAGREAIAALQPVVEGLKEAFVGIINDDAMSNFQELGRAVGEALPALGSIFSLLGDMAMISAIGAMVEILGRLAEIINLIPDPLLEFAGVMVIAFKAVQMMSPALKLLDAGFKTALKGAEAMTTGLAGLAKGNAVLIAAFAAITVGIAAYDAFTAKSRQTEQATKDLTVALSNQIDMMISAGEVSAGAALGQDAFNQAIAEMPGKGEDFQKALGNMGLGVEDMRRVILDMDKDSTAALTSLAEGMGLPTDAAKTLADAVMLTDDNFTSSQAKSGKWVQMFGLLADETGMSEEALIKLAQAMAQARDTAEDFDLDKVAQSELDLARGGTEAEKALLKQAEATQAAGDIAQGIIPLYDEYVRLLNEQENAADDASSANERQASSTILVQNAINDAIAAHEAEQAAMAASRKEAMDKYKAEVKLAEATEDAAAAILASSYATDDAAGRMAAATNDIIDIGSAMRDSAAEADALNDAFSILFGSGLDAQSTFDAFYNSINDLNEELMETGESALPRVGSGLEAVFGTTPAALGFRDAMASGVQEMLAYAEAAVADGVASEAINTNLQLMRDSLVTTGAQFGLTTEEVDGFISSLVGTPELISTIVQTPGLIDALLNAENLNLLYDEAGNPVITEFEAAGIDPAMATVQGFEDLVTGLDNVTGAPHVSAANIDPAAVATDALQGDIAVLDESSAAPSVDPASIEDTITTIEDAQRSFDALDKDSARPDVTIPRSDIVIAEINTMQEGIDTLDADSASIPVTLPQIQAQIDKVKELDAAIKGLPLTRTVTIVTRPLNGAFMAGGIVNGPSTVNVGERGYTEAIVPMQLPLNRIDPSVRQFAEILRGGSSPGQVSSSGKTVNNYMTIQPASADPAAVATQIINRSAALANR